jgi:hypothetical protein
MGDPKTWAVLVVRSGTYAVEDRYWFHGDLPDVGDTIDVDSTHGPPEAPITIRTRALVTSVSADDHTWPIQAKELG